MDAGAVAADRAIRLDPESSDAFDALALSLLELTGEQVSRLRR